MTKESIRKKLEDLRDEDGMVIFYNRKEAYSLHRSGSSEVLTKLYPGRVTPLHDNWDAIDLSSMVQCLSAEETIERGGIPEILEQI